MISATHAAASAWHPAGWRRGDSCVRHSVVNIACATPWPSPLLLEAHPVDVDACCWQQSPLTAHRKPDIDTSSHCKHQMFTRQTQFETMLRQCSGVNAPSPLTTWGVNARGKV